MTRIRLLRLSLLAVGMAGAVQPAFAQTSTVSAGNPDADRLAQQIRVLAADPRDVRALLDAGMLSTRLNDTAAALAFYARAEALDPTNPRILSGRASVLVRMERPGEALRLFQTAEARGLPSREFAADRGFAYDLLGQPALAQQDYRAALQGEREDDTVRRYALSLGISGNAPEAMRQLDQLLRRSDRAAWRARAFVMAMNGDVAGAEKIAASMMPGNMSTALSPFFRRLATLSSADRAFAVHFGALSPTPARLADARLAPPLPRAGPAEPPVQIASAPRPSPTPRGRDRRDRRERTPASGARIPIVETAVPVEAPPPPRFVQQPSAPIVQPLAKPTADQIDNRPVGVPVQLASAPAPTPKPTTAVQPSTTSTASQVSTPTPAAPVRTAAGEVSDQRHASPVQAEPRLADTFVRTAATQPIVADLPRAAQPLAAGPAPQGAAVRTDAGLQAAAPVRPEPAPPGPARAGQEDSVLAAIVANITIPAEELEVVVNPAADPVPEPVRPAPALRAVRPEPKPVPARKPETVKPDSKAKKPDPKAKEPAKPEPKRIWVQVAGGANQESLPKAWKAVVAKAPAAFKGKSPWWMPQRATNRVLAGPFKTAAEAQAFVNALAKSDLSAFVFSSEAGQKVTKLAVQ